MSLGPALAWRLLRAEGPRSLYERWIDRRRDAARRRAFPAATRDVAGRLLRDVNVVNLLATPPWQRLGGLQQQLLARLEMERSERPVALLFPEPGARWRLEVQTGDRRAALDLGTTSLEDVVRAALAETGARILHVEGLAGFDLGALALATSTAQTLVVSLHDFSALRRRLHLSAFEDVEDPEHARRGAALLGSARVVVFPSEFLRREHRRLLPETQAGVWPVVAPALDWEAVTPNQARPPNPRRRIAFAGAFSPHKGALEFEELVGLLTRRHDVAWSVFGGSGPDPAPLLRQRRAGVRIHGYYRAGSLPRRLAAARVDLALLLSTWPEAYGLTLDECRLAGVPVVCFDHGAMADRVRAHGGGLLVDPRAGAAGVARRLADLLDGTQPWPEATAAARADAPTAGGAAGEMRSLYATVGG